MVTIAVLTIVVFVGYLMQIMILTQAEFYDMWYLSVALPFMVPFYFAAIKSVEFLQKDHFESREGMWWACIYVILSVTFLNGWDITYTFYISDEVRPNGF